MAGVAGRGAYGAPGGGAAAEAPSHSLSGVPYEDERELLATGTQAVSAQTAKQPILGSYLPVDTVQRYTFKKWDPSDWSRHNETKKFQSSRDREASRQ